MFSTAVILAGGRGTRIQKSFPGVAKPMVPIAGKPVLQHIIETYSAQGIERFFITIGHLSKQIEDFFKDGARLGVEIIYIREDEPLGTAGALFTGRYRRQSVIHAKRCNECPDTG